MSFVSVSVGSIFLLRWISVEVGDVSKLLVQVRDLAARYPSKVAYIAVAPPQIPPGDAERNEIASGMPELMRLCRSVHLVIEQTGFSGAVQRTIAAGMLLVQGGRGKALVHASLEDALAKLDNITLPQEQIMSSARAAGIARRP